jgi:hypothetical protein
MRGGGLRNLFYCSAFGKGFGRKRYYPRETQKGKVSIVIPFRLIKRENNLTPRRKVAKTQSFTNHFIFTFAFLLVTSTPLRLGGLCLFALKIFSCFINLKGIMVNWSLADSINF